MEILRNCILFSDLSEIDINKLLEVSHPIFIEQGNYFLREGEPAENLYFILDGKVAITKTDKHQKNEHVIAYLESGQTIGEIAFFDHKSRSASARTELPTKLLSISFEAIKKLADESPAFNKVLLRFAENIGGRMRQSDTVIVDAVEKQLLEYKMRTSLGLFMMNVIIALCLFTFFLTWITQQSANAISSTKISAPVTGIFVILFLLIMKDSKLPLRTFGLTTHNWLKAVVESILFSIVVCGIIVVFKWILIKTTIRETGKERGEPFLQIHADKNTTLLMKENMWWMIFITYVFIIVPLQELIVRGGLQSTLEVFLTEKHINLKAIIVSNLLFSTTHLFLGTEIALLVFIGGIYFGWLYMRHHTLIGVILAHGIVGVWALMVVGL